MNIRNYMDLLVLSSNEGTADCIEIDFDEEGCRFMGNIIRIDVDLFIMKSGKRVKRGDLLKLKLGLKKEDDFSEKLIEELQDLYLDNCDNLKEMQHQFKWNKQFNKDIKEIFKKQDKIFNQCKECIHYEKFQEKIPYRNFKCKMKGGVYLWDADRIDCKSFRKKQFAKKGVGE